jgi:hypothetical protein
VNPTGLHSPRPNRALRIALLAIAAVALLVLGWGRGHRRAGGLIAPLLASVAGTAQATPERRKPNRLIHEKSPYLLQHAYNPVDWYPWGVEAFEKARREDKPIFLSIGYSTCHWCHVMEHESFEDDSVAALLNRDFVPIKVDREERPDVDRLYMTSMQAMGMGGGWPLNAFLTPDLEPFFGGTYFPPRTSMGRPGMLEILGRVHEVWGQQHDQLRATGRRVFEAIGTMSVPERAGVVDREQLFAHAADSLTHTFDSTYGGFGTAPKFPSVVNVNFLLRWWARDRAHHADALEMVSRQLDAMRAGGIHDHLGGGFHRYSTDREWLVPHFEKMLYDQAQLAWAYVEFDQVAHDRRFAATARDIFAYVARDLTAPEGAFYSAEDADSEGEEGKFYVWTPAQIASVLGSEDARPFYGHYGVTEAGNFEHGTSILHAGGSELEGDAEHRLAADRTKLLAARSKRVRPHLDDKVITAWNGLMISAFARGARVLDDASLNERSSRAGEFIWTRLHNDATGDLMRRWRDGEAKGAGQLDDYAYLALGYIDLYQSSFDPKWLARAKALTEAMLARFWDEKEGGFFESPAGDPEIKVRMKDGFDGAEIAGNSIALLDLQLLGVLFDRRDWLEKAGHGFDYYARRLDSVPAAMPQMLVAMELAQSKPRHIVIAGRPEAADTRALIAEFNRRFLPHDVLLLVDGGERQKALAAVVPFVAPLVMKDGKATAYVCENYACQLPTTDRSAFAAQLERTAPIPEKKR